MANCSFVVVFKDNKVLLVKLADVYAFAGHWNFPGGVADNANETLEECAKRETFEETGIVVNIGKRIEFISHPNNDITKYIGQYVSGDIVIQEDEISAADWFTINEALKLPLAYDIKTTLLSLKDT